MRVVVGGQLDPAEVIGRDVLASSIWQTLERQSVILSAERRVGKTSLIQKMRSAPPTDYITVYRDLEGIKDPLEFALSVHQDVAQYLSIQNKAGTHLQNFMNLFGGIQVGTILKLPDNMHQRHWKDLLTATIKDLSEQQERTIIFFWDELPYMIYDIARTKGEDAAIEILDTLRQLRSHHKKVRMVFTGSIGLHNVVTSLKKKGYANHPTNDMKSVDVPNLAPEYAQQLAKKLLEGEGVNTDDLISTAGTIATVCDGNAFYIQFVVERLARTDEQTSSVTVLSLIEECLTDPQDGWHMRHYRERIDTYYTDNEDRQFALAILDIVASSVKPIHFAHLFNNLKVKIVTEDEERARDVIVLLQRDHYLRQEKDGGFRFNFPLIQRSWRLQRGLIIQEAL